MQTRRVIPATVYIGPERRKERRRIGNNTFEKLLLEFGLDRRISIDQRDSSSSWLLLSEKSLSA